MVYESYGCVSVGQVTREKSVEKWGKIEIEYFVS